jgi:hypothetical protein
VSGSAFGEQCRVRVVCEGRFELPLAPDEALAFFTPEGERAWAGPAWNPVYPDPGAAVDDSAPGTVFSTESHGGDATWVVVDRTASTIRYARFVPGRIAGTIAVRCDPGASDGETEVTVTYDITSLGPDEAEFVERLRDGYDAFLGSWREEIVATIA